MIAAYGRVSFWRVVVWTGLKEGLIDWRGVTRNEEEGTTVRNESDCDGLVRVG